MTPRPWPDPDHIHGPTEETMMSDEPNVIDMTLRDYFAGQALVAMGLWFPSRYSEDGQMLPPLNLTDARVHSVRAEWAYAAADAMLAARQKPIKERADD